jgi:GTP-binding protein
MAELPVVVIVGRPNVGKSTLFNAITGQRRAIVGNEPGITRDRLHGAAEYGGTRFELIDTGGIIVDDAEMIPAQILRQARMALARASEIIFLIDGRTEITGADRDLAAMLRKLAKPVSVVVNKVDPQSRDIPVHEFHSLGFPDVFPVSAEHRLGLNDLLEHVTRNLPQVAEEPEDSGDQPKTISVAIIGRPNVGKSTLLNALVGSERAIVSPVAGTTRDSIDETVEVDGKKFTFVDTAGIRRKAKTREMAEKLSVVMARRNIRMANVVLLVLDASEGLVGLDATIAGYSHEEGRALVIVVNKWDAAPDKNQARFKEKVRDEFKFLDYAAIAFVSAKQGRGIKPLFGLIRKCFEAASKRISTGQLNRFVERIHFEQNVKIFYMTQASVRPPTFIVFTDRGSHLHFSHERFIVNQLRKQFGFEGTPIELKTKRR